MNSLDQLAERLPAVGDRNLAVRITRDAERWLRGGSPWLYDQSIQSISHEGQPGDLAVIFDRQRDFMAIGLYDPDSPIRVKMLHVGSPRPIDAGYWSERIDEAVGRRATLIADPGTTGYRVVHGENDAMPGLVVDRYGDTAVVKLYSAAWWPHLAAVVGAVVERIGVERVVLRLARNVDPVDRLTDGEVLIGPAVTAPVEFVERGLVFEADVVSGQKTGHFLDQRDNRAIVRELAEGRSVLDAFASTGGFAVNAAAGGAQRIHMVDLATPAIATAHRNLDHNAHLPAVSRATVSSSVADAFDELARLGAAGERFDLVVVDPPSFAQNQASVDKALGAYRRLTELAVRVVEPGGILMQCSCSSRVPADDFFDAVTGAAARVGRPLNDVRHTGHAVDHPIGFEHGAYLKALIARV